MPWHVLLILLIPVIVAILANLLRNAEQQNRKDRPGSSSGEFRTLSRQQGRPVTDLDRFLEEARRRREPTERREVSVEREKPQPPRPAPAPRQQRSSRPTSSRSRGERVPPRRQIVVLEEEVVTRPSVPAPAPKAVPEAKPARSVEEPPAPPAAASPPPPLPVAVREKAVSPLLRQVMQNLRTPRSAAVAIVLREIFAPPLCKRRRGMEG